MEDSFGDSQKERNVLTFVTILVVAALKLFAKAICWVEKNSREKESDKVYFEFRQEFFWLKII
jgi:hypothetical protein